MVDVKHLTRRRPRLQFHFHKLEIPTQMVLQTSRAKTSKEASGASATRTGLEITCAIGSDHRKGFLRRVPTSAYFALSILHGSDRQAPRAMREERRSAVCACARACVRVLSAGVRHRRALLCTRERVLFIERHHSAPEILRGKTSRRAWEIEGILLARTRRSPRSLKPRSPLSR